jgi:hypothetical protein
MKTIETNLTKFVAMIVKGPFTSLSDAAWDLRYALRVFALRAGPRYKSMITNLGRFRVQHRIKWLKIGLALPALMVGLSACENFNFDNFGDDGGGQKSLVAATDPVALRIAESADKAATALQDLARVEQTRRPPIPEPPSVSANSELQNLVTIDWVGGAEELVRNLAVRLKYDVVVTGTVPNVPVIVQIHQRDRTVLEALRNIGEQATQYVDIVVDSQQHKIELRYKTPEPTQS